MRRGGGGAGVVVVVVVVHGGEERTRIDLDGRAACLALPRDSATRLCSPRSALSPTIVPFRFASTSRTPRRRIERVYVRTFAARRRPARMTGAHTLDGATTRTYVRYGGLVGSRRISPRKSRGTKRRFVLLRVE